MLLHTILSCCFWLTLLATLHSVFFFVAGEIYELFIIASLLRFLLSGQKFWPPLLHFGESDRIRMIDRFISFARIRSLDDLSRDAHLRVARSDVHRDSILTLVFFLS